MRLSTRSLSFAVMTALFVWPCGAFAAAKTPIRTRTIHAERGKRYDATTKYPVLLDKTPLAALANHTISADVRKEQAEFIQMALRETAKEPQENPYGYDVSPAYQRYWKPGLYSVALEFYQFTGGAHGYSYRVMYNFALVDGKPRRMFLKDFFKDGTDYRKQVEKTLMDKLHHDERAEFIREVAQLSPAQLNRFTIEPDGLRFWFNPYEVASYARGPVDIKLKFADLGPDLRRDLIPLR
jgi:hypothetical protein